ncbi:MAG TPA: SDR family oxidoreductase [Planctomycetota bacterium]|nr:SDR family oxidoreductase [Planctomycetota bacterium]
MKPAILYLASVDLHLADKTVLITGASGGIGRALAEVFAAEGASLALFASAHAADLEAYVATRDWRARAVCLAADLREPRAVEQAFHQAIARFGRVDVCVANAGAWPRENQLLHEASVERIRSTLDSNLFSALWTARAFFAALKQCGPRNDGHGAALTFIGSTAGRFGERHHADYACAKSGLQGLVASLKNEIVLLDPFARVNLVQPGWTATHMVRPELQERGTIQRVTRTMPLRQLARAVDIARMVAGLSSPTLSRHVSGESITVAGGMEGRVLWNPEDIDEAAVRERLSKD